MERKRKVRVVSNTLTIPYELKCECIAARKSGMKVRDIYDKIFYPAHSSLSLNTFQTKLPMWIKKQMADEKTLHAGTYPYFIPHDATVQVNSKGEILQAWIKQTKESEEAYNALLETIQKGTTPVMYKELPPKESDVMLELGLYDMHIPLTNYIPAMHKIINTITKKHYDEINIIVGQDMFHNDDFRGRTSKGTPIEKVDMVKAWTEASTFYTNIINYSILNSNKVNLIYIKGNHDESLSWAFVQMLKVRFPAVYVNDTMEKRKCIYWKNCFIGLTHGNEAKSKPTDFRGQFTIRFSKEFSDATVREIHAGHLHTEDCTDVYGVLVRRLSTAHNEDDWSDDNGYVGSIKRFMLFEWTPGELSSIHYITNTE